MIAGLPPPFGCNTCTRRLIEIAYARTYMFRFIREPLKLGMYLWVKIKRIDLSKYSIAVESCGNCARFYKNALKDNSGFFRLLNNRINPVFDRVLERIVTDKEVLLAKKHASAAVKGEVIPPGWNIKGNMKEWLKI